MNVNPSKIFKIGTQINLHEKADLSIWNFDENYNIDSNTFLSKGRATPFDGKNVFGKCKMTLVNGQIVYNEIDK